MTWVFDYADGIERRPRLMYRSVGVEGMAFNLLCTQTGVQIALARAGPAPDTWPLTLRSGDVQTEMLGATEGESEVVVRATLAATAPVLLNFRRTGLLEETDQGTTTVLNAINDEERAAVEHFFEACTL
jgi:hypothetical protein